MTTATDRSAIRAVTTALAVSVALAACGSGSSAPSTTGGKSGAAKVGVAISNYSYHPATITVPAGTKVTFSNRDQTAHTATGTAAGFDTGTLKPGHAATVELNKPGSYTYYCQFHAFMRGTIVVR